MSPNQNYYSGSKRCNSVNGSKTSACCFIINNRFSSLSIPVRNDLGFFPKSALLQNSHVGAHAIVNRPSNCSKNTLMVEGGGGGGGVKAK